MGANAARILGLSVLVKPARNVYTVEMRRLGVTLPAALAALGCLDPGGALASRLQKPGAVQSAIPTAGPAATAPGAPLTPAVTLAPPAPAPGPLTFALPAAPPAAVPADKPIGGPLLAAAGSDAKRYEAALAPSSGPEGTDQAASLAQERYDGGPAAAKPGAQAAVNAVPGADVGNASSGLSGAAPRRPQAAGSPAVSAPTGKPKARGRLGGLKDFLAAPLGLFKKPSNNRDWAVDNAVLPYARFEGDKVTVRNIRDFTYRRADDYTPSYYDASYDLKDLQSVWFVVEPFAARGLLAHTFLSFGFKDGRHLAVSVEIRKVKGQTFSPWKGLFNNFEIAYVVSDERDVIGLRANHRRNPVRVYPVKTSAEKARALFTDMLQRATRLKDHPEFYNSITNTCLSNIVRHLNRISHKKLHHNIKVLLPGLSDRLAYDRGLLDTDLPFPQARERFLINDRAGNERDPNFSRRIRAPR